MAPLEELELVEPDDELLLLDELPLEEELELDELELLDDEPAELLLLPLLLSFPQPTRKRHAIEII